MRKNTQKSTSRRFTVLIEQNEDGVYLANVPALVGCRTQGRTLTEVEERVKDAISLYLDVARSRGRRIQGTRLVGVHQVEVP